MKSNQLSSNYSSNNYDPSKRSNSYKKNEANERPSTAPHKNDNEEKFTNPQLNSKRMPSPVIKGKIILF